MLGAYAKRAAQRHAEAAASTAVYERFPRLAERRAQRADTLSGGERQMLALGRALMSAAAPADARRAQPRPRAADRARDPRASCAALRERRRVDPAGRAERARRARNLGPRLRARDRRDRARPALRSTLASDPRVQATYLGGGTDDDDCHDRGRAAPSARCRALLQRQAAALRRPRRCVASPARDWTHASDAAGRRGAARRGAAARPASGAATASR